MSDFLVDLHVPFAETTGTNSYRSYRGSGDHCNPVVAHFCWRVTDGRYHAEEITLNRKTHTIVQAILAFCQIVNTGGILPIGWSHIVTVVLSATQAAVAIIQQSYNPDGSTAAVAYVPVTEKKP